MGESLGSLPQQRKASNFTKASPLLIEIVGTLFIGLFVSIFSYLLLETSQSEESLGIVMQRVLEQRETLFWLQVSVAAALFLWIKSLFSSKWISAALLLITAFSFSIANEQKLLLRGEPLYPADLSMVKNFSFLMEMVSKETLFQFFVAIGLIAIITGSLVYIEKKNQKRIARKAFWGMKAAAFIISSFFVFHIIQFNQPGSFFYKMFEPYTDWTEWRQETNYSDNGFITGFLYNLNSPALDKPEGYSQRAMAQLNEKYGRSADEINAVRSGSFEDVNVIFVMNESFSDPLNLSGISLSEDPIPHTRKLMEEETSGSILSSGYGGGTANIEFAALTGISMEPLSNTLTTPYIQLTDKMKTIPSIVSYFNQMEHTTTAIHPYNTTMYKRMDVYDYMGFDSFIDETKLTNPKHVENNRYISDSSAYDEVLATLTETSGQDFIHLVTMHNHGGYANNYENLSIDVQGVNNEEEAKQYYQGLQYSDQDTKVFFDQLEHVEEKVMVVFWGDHLPGFYNEEVFQEYGKLDKHETPLMIYSNFELDGEPTDIGIISPVYFQNHLFELVNAPVTPYHALLMELEKNLPAFEKGRYIGTDKIDIKSNREELDEETQELLHEYDLLLYDLTTGNQYSKELGLFDAP